MEFNDLAWHDAVIKNIEVDRSDPGNKDVISIEIKWLNGTINQLVFEDVYWAQLTMNFGVIATESIKTAQVADKNDLDLINVSSKLKNFIGDVKLVCYEINTNSTNSTIKIIAKTFNVTG